MKKVLIVCYYWPPAGGPGVQRWLSFTKYLTTYGIAPVVYIPENPTYPIIDNTLTSQVPEGVTVIKQPIKEPYKIAKLFSKKKTATISSGIITQKNASFLEKAMLFIRGNIFIPDARVGWVKPSIKFLENYLVHNDIDTVITTGPPHSLHLIGLGLQKKINVQWVTDFRDPWTTIHYHKSLQLLKVSEKKHQQLEAQVLQNAAHIIVTSPTTKKEFRAITKQPITVITNGFEPHSNNAPQVDQCFSIAHIGSFLSERNHKNLWISLKQLCEEITGFKQDLKIVLAGAISDHVFKSIDEYNLNSCLDYKGYLSHQEVIELQEKSQVLLLLEMDKPETKAIIPGKLFEYLRAKRPILAIGPQGSDIAQILDETNHGVFVTPASVTQIKAQIKTLYKKFKEGTITINSRGVEQYTRRELTKKLALVITSL